MSFFNRRDDSKTIAQKTLMTLGLTGARSEIFGFQFSQLSCDILERYCMRESISLAKGPKYNKMGTSRAGDSLGNKKSSKSH